MESDGHAPRTRVRQWRPALRRGLRARPDDEDPKWRGHIQYIQGPEEVYFQNLTEMSEFLEQVSGVPSLGFAGHPGKVVEISRRNTAVRKKRKLDK